MEARLIQDESFEDAATEWIGMLHPSRETYKAAAIQCDVNYRRANADLFAALTESAALRAEIATLRHVNDTLTHTIAIQIETIATLRADASQAAADLARERERHQQVLNYVNILRRNDVEVSAGAILADIHALLAPQPAPAAPAEETR